MSMEKTRREFLKSSAVGLAAAATARTLPAFSSDTTEKRGGIAAWVTSGQESLCTAERTAMAHRARQVFRARDCSQPGEAIPDDFGFRRRIYRRCLLHIQSTPAGGARKPVS